MVWSCIVVLLLVGLPLHATASNVRPVGTSGWHIYYRVLNSRTDGVIPGAEVQEYQPSCPVLFGVHHCDLFPTYMNQSGVATAQASGSNNEIPNGTYEIVANASGFNTISASFANVTIHGANANVTLLLGQLGGAPLYSVEYHVIDYFKRIPVPSMFCEGAVNQIPPFYPCHTYTDAGGTHTDLVGKGGGTSQYELFVNATGYHNLTRITAIDVQGNLNITLPLIWSNATQYVYTVTVLDHSTHAPVVNANVTLCGYTCVGGAWLSLTGATGNATFLVYNIVNYSFLYVSALNYQSVAIPHIGYITKTSNATVYLNSTNSSGILGILSNLLQDPMFYVAIVILVGVAVGAILIYHGRRKQRRTRSVRKSSRFLK